ncbi:hypothetical protein B0H10DRAFT_1905503 [Mycena sp. CBHHK59/15]|nr:hypothetical protein B0H10DRAFT_1905503 [Mycena sp. CBHHK59/15]
MPIGKRRILVVFESDGARLRKIAISIDKDATNGDLAREIAATLHEPAVTLEVSGGFELRDEDGVDMIEEGDVVTARAGAPAARIIEPPQSHVSLKSRAEYATSSDEPERFQMRLVTAEHARLHARRTPKDQSEPTTGVFAFDGEFVSGNTTLRSLEREAARALGWPVSDNTDLCEHHDEGACSCAVAREIEQHGLASTRHCRFTIDGSRCAHAACPYSHVDLTHSQPNAPPHCSICTDALAFPCPTCLAHAESAGAGLESVVFCPLVQNAGCGHLHHAHCLGARTDTSAAGCPSGCPAEQFPREPAALDMRARHLVIAWDGDRIDRIDVPVWASAGVAGGNALRLTTDAVVTIVEDFLERQDFARPGLSLRIHFRDPVSEAVHFSQSTLVSVCPASSHQNQNYRRFSLFPALIPHAQQPTPTTAFSVDLHTAASPVAACGCTPIKQLFAHPNPGVAPNTTVVLYAVQRRNDPTEDSTKCGTVSKQSAYLADAAWHPSVAQTPRGIAALLASLYLLAHAVAQKGAAAEQKVLAVANALWRFPPAVRTLAALLLNKIPRPEEKAALAEALFHPLGEFAARGPPAICGRADRRFETVRILLAYIASAADAESAAPARRAVDDISLLCALSHKRLADPVLFDSTVIERSLAVLHQPGGALYRPAPTTHVVAITEIPPDDVLRQLFAHCRGQVVTSALLLRVEDIGPAPPAFMTSIDAVARDFVATIRRANATDLVCRGPLELKSLNVVAPQIVLDQDGLLAVFTGRGCGSTRDVNFFRPTNGGDTEVDVNDVSYALQKVINARKLEDTWQVDSFGEVAAIVRPPDEAIVLCLDLSQSMNNPSGVSKPASAATHNVPFDVPAEANKIVQIVVADMADAIILENAKAHLQSQHVSCHHPWAILVDDRGDNGTDLLNRLAVLASRSLVQLSLTHDDEPETSDDGIRDTMLQLACYIFVQSDIAMDQQLRNFLSEILITPDVDTIGEEPFDVPRKLLDCKTGELLLYPARPMNAPPQTFVNTASKQWFDSQSTWPAGHWVPSYDSVSQVRKAVERWISGTDILPVFFGSWSMDNVVAVTLRHIGKETTWRLIRSTSTRTLYSLVNRATHAKYSSFSLRLCTSKAAIKEGNSLTLGQTALANGGAVEMIGFVPHARGTHEIQITADDELPPQIYLLQQDASTLALLSYLNSANPWIGIDDAMLWHGLRDSGDGIKRGNVVQTDALIADYEAHGRAISFQCLPWHWIVPRAQRTRESSRHLSRLDLLKELFNVFLNRAGSFDTSVSLVLGLVTFSSKSSVEQELTPVFENFRQRLDRVKANGDTAVYEALDSARQILINYRPDLPDLRKRIIIVSDGEDTSSTISAQEVCCMLQKGHVIVDSVQVGTRSDPVLHAISVATGGYRFSPKTSLADALSIFDLETMLFSGERPSRAAKPLVASEVQFRNYQNFYYNPIDLITVDQFPARAEHVKLKHRVKFAAISVGSMGGGDDRMKRIMREIKAVVADPHPNIDIYVDDSDMSFLKIILEAPRDVENCPYKGGTFLLTCDLPTAYPRDPPEIRFVTFILHPNVSKQGKVCIAELGRLWSSDITLKEIFSMIYGTLLTPDLENPLEIQASLKYYDDDGTYALAVADAVKKHASKSRMQWKEELDT